MKKPKPTNDLALDLSCRFYSIGLDAYFMERMPKAQKNLFLSGKGTLITVKIKEGWVASRVVSRSIKGLV